MVFNQNRVGVELDEPNGRNNGSTPSGEILFHCEPLHGVFVKTTVVKPEATAVRAQCGDQLKGVGPEGDDDAAVAPLSAADAWMVIGARCMVAKRGMGTVRWIGVIGKALRVGVELDQPNGLNDGSVPNGPVLFRCKPKHGIFVVKTAVTKPEDDDDDLFGFGI